MSLLDRDETSILSMDEVNKDRLLDELLVRVQDIESSLPEPLVLDSRQSPIPMLPSSATLAEVIEVLNSLNKRTLILNRIK